MKKILIIQLDYCFENANTIIIERIFHQLKQDYDDKILSIGFKKLVKNEIFLFITIDFKLI